MAWTVIYTRDFDPAKPTSIKGQTVCKQVGGVVLGTGVLGIPIPDDNAKIIISGGPYSGRYIVSKREFWLREEKVVVRLIPDALQTPIGKPPK